MRKSNQRNENKDNETEPKPLTHLFLLDLSGSSASQQPARPWLGGSMQSTWITMILMSVASVGASVIARQLGGTISHFCKERTRGSVDRLCHRLVEKRTGTAERADDQRMISADSQNEGNNNNNAEPKTLELPSREVFDNDGEADTLESLFREVFDLVDEGVAGIGDGEVYDQLQRAFEAAGLV
jgi:hypothetical protein